MIGAVADRAAQVIARDLAFPEGPMFDRLGNLWCVELKAGRLARLGPDGALDRFTVGGAPNGLALDVAGGLWFCDADHNAVRRLDPATGETATIIETVDGQALDRPNDLAFDAAGNLIFTCPGSSRTEPTGYVCCRTPDGACAVIADGLYFPNGLAFTPEGDLVLAETRRQRLWRGVWDASARRWVDPAPLCATAGAPIGPDGLAIDAEGRIFAAIYGAGLVEIFAPDGQRLGALTTPGANASNCAFDPSGRLGLVVTETARGEVLAFAADAPGLPLALGPAPKTSEGAHVH